MKTILITFNNSVPDSTLEEFWKLAATVAEITETRVTVEITSSHTKVFKSPSPPNGTDAIPNLINFM